MELPLDQVRRVLASGSTVVVVTLNSLGLTPTMPRSAIRPATVSRLTRSPACQVGGDPRRAVGPLRRLVKRNDLGVQIGLADLAGQKITVLGRSPAVIARSDTSSRRAIRVISKVADSAAINANLSALVDSKRSTRQLFPRRPGPCPAQPPGGATSTTPYAPPRSAHPNCPPPPPTGVAHRVPTGPTSYPPPTAHRHSQPTGPIDHTMRSLSLDPT